MAKNNKAADLLKLLGQKAPTAPPTPKAPVSAPPASARGEHSGARTRRPQPQAAQPRAGRGKAIQFYLHDADEKLIREFSVWLAPHRKRINDSLIVKAVLRSAKTGPDLLAAYDAGLAISKAHQKKRKLQEGMDTR